LFFVDVVDEGYGYAGGSRFVYKFCFFFGAEGDKVLVDFWDAI
jgi:hypothetical protein